MSKASQFDEIDIFLHPTHHFSRGRDECKKDRHCLGPQNALEMQLSLAIKRL